MQQNRGKKFEQLIAESFKEKNVFLLRLYDTMYLAARNPCDFVAVINGKPVMLECKSTYDTAFSPKVDFEDTSVGHQWKCLKEASEYNILAGYIIWFIDYDVTVFVRIQEFEEYLKKNKRKSINYKDALEIGFEIKARKKQIYFEYDMTEFIEYASNH